MTTICIQQAGTLLDLGREWAEFGDEAIPEALEHLHHGIPERIHRVKAQTDRQISGSDYHHVAKLQDCAQSHIDKKITLSIGSLLSTMIQNLSQVFQSINVYPTFTNAIDAPTVATPFLILGIFTSVLSFAIAMYSTYKVAVLQKKIDSLDAAKAKLDPTEPKKEIYQLTQDLLTLERNKAIRNIVLSVLSIAAFILSNVVSMGIPLLAVIGCCILVAIVKICLDIKATRDMKTLCRELQAKIVVVGYGSAWDDSAFKKLMALVIPVIQKETGFCFDEAAMSYVDLVKRLHPAA